MHHILYSFRRCPYAMRARLALLASGITVELREVKLAAKPESMLKASPKGTVPVLITQDGTIIDESLSIMRWALSQRDPDGWLSGDVALREDLIRICDGDFKYHLDRTKYPTRYEDADPLYHRDQAALFLARLEKILSPSPYLLGERLTLTDAAILPFVRQFAQTDRAWFDAMPYPALQRWLNAFLASAAFGLIMPKHQPWAEGQPPLFYPA